MNYYDMIHAIRDRAIELLEVGWTQEEVIESIRKIN